MGASLGRYIGALMMGNEVPGGKSKPRGPLVASDRQKIPLMGMGVW